MALSDFGNIIFIGGFFKPMFLHGSKYVVVVFFLASEGHEGGRAALFHLCE